MDKYEGISMLARCVSQEAEDQVKGQPLTIDFGVINGDMSLTTNSYDVKIPVDDYQVCRQLTLGAKDKVLYKTQVAGQPNDGKHSHGPSGEHSQYSGSGTHSHTDEAPHIHDVLISEKMRSIKPGDRVLVVWVGNDAVVVDIIFPAKEAFTYNV